jgi:uncharacterized membrane protein YjjP (DUF1212 family)
VIFDGTASPFGDPAVESGGMSPRRLHTKLLLQAGRLLLEHNESTGVIHRALTTTARALTEEVCYLVVSYRGVAVSLGAEEPALEAVAELRYNAAVQARVHDILGQVRRGDLDPPAALACLGGVEADTPRHSPWLAAPALGVAAAALAALLGADVGAAAVVAVATGLGLLARRELGRRHFSLLALPLAAALVGAVLGGLAIRLGWTRSPELALIVPALMVVPGPHLINGLFDLIDNFVPMSLSRLGLAAGILLASALGIVLGVELTLPDPVFAEAGADAGHLNLVADVVLAGIVTCGFAVFYNTAWPHLWMAAVGGMAGHGLRFLALEAGCRLEAATFLGGLTVGAVAAWMARSSKTPVAVLAFAGAVTMIPGLSVYRALGGALQLTRSPDLSDPAMMAGTLGNALQACLIVSGLALGLLVGARAVLALADEPDAPVRPRVGHDLGDAARGAALERGPDRPAGRMSSAPPG